MCEGKPKRVFYLIIFIGMLGDQLGGTVGQEFVLFDDDVALALDGAKITELDSREVRLENEDVVELHVEMAQVFRVDPFEGGADLLRDLLGVGLTDPEVVDVRRQVAHGRVLRAEHAVLALDREHKIRIDGEDVLVGAEELRVVELA